MSERTKRERGKAAWQHTNSTSSSTSSRSVFSLRAVGHAGLVSRADRGPIDLSNCRAAASLRCSTIVCSASVFGRARQVAAGALVASGQVLQCTSRTQQRAETVRDHLGK